LSNHYYTYCKYFIIGLFVGIAAIISREFIGALLPDETPLFYGLSVIVIYIGGTILSYIGHRTVTFVHVKSPQGTAISLLKFIITSVIGGIVTTTLSIFFLYGLPLELLAGKFSPAVAFGLAAIVASFVTYYINAVYTFADTQASDN